MISYVLREWQIHLSEETLSKQFCSGCAEIAFMRHGGQNLEIELVIDFAYFAFVAREKKNKTRNCSFKHTNSVQNFSLSFLSAVGPTCDNQPAYNTCLTY